MTSIPIEQTKYSNKAVIKTWKCEQNWDLSSKILSKIGPKAGKKNQWEKKQNRLCNILMTNYML